MTLRRETKRIEKRRDGGGMRGSRHGVGRGRRIAGRVGRHRSGTGNPGTPAALAQFRKLRSNAYSVLEIYPEDTEALRKWFQTELAKIQFRGNDRASRHQKIDAAALTVRQKLASWSKGVWGPEA